MSEMISRVICQPSSYGSEAGNENFFNIPKQVELNDDNTPERVTNYKKLSMNILRIASIAEGNTNRISNKRLLQHLSGQIVLKTCMLGSICKEENFPSERIWILAIWRTWRLEAA
ncbi:unnamed protein product [Moneuplotes crassus]|uniref:Uncharacterized protein n=1 Tax=Euplotes crassus TaxID=5936 RepID=A0AAD1UBV1_EUPCR|nr:unnamed protein product [Moneuplotes crassus]